MSKIRIFQLSCLFFLAPIISAKGQVQEAIHLSYNFTDCCTVRKNIDDSGKKHFFIQNEHFVSNDPRPVTILTDKQLDGLSIVGISDFLEVADKERKRLIESGEKTGTIKVLLNDQVFKQIFLYEKTETGEIQKYPVTWIEEIE